MSEASRGWSNDPNVTLGHRILMYAAEHPQGGIEEVSEALGADPADVGAIVDALGGEGLLVDDHRLSGPTVDLGPAGQRLLQSWAAARSRRASRAMACRSALLDWLYEQSDDRSPEGHELLGDVRGYFYGVQFNSADIDEARVFLAEQGLLLGIQVYGGPGHLRPTITNQGKICVEQFDSDVAAFLAPTRRENSVNYNTSIHGSSGFQVANASPGASMHSTVTITDDHRQQLVEITRQIAEQISGLPQSLQPEAQEALAELEAAVQDPAASRGRLRAAIDKIAITAVTAIGTEAGKAMAGLAGQAIGSLTS